MPTCGSHGLITIKAYQHCWSHLHQNSLHYSKIIEFIQVSKESFLSWNDCNVYTWRQYYGFELKILSRPAAVVWKFHLSQGWAGQQDRKTDEKKSQSERFRSFKQESLFLLMFIVFILSWAKWMGCFIGCPISSLNMSGYGNTSHKLVLCSKFEEVTLSQRNFKTIIRLWVCSSLFSLLFYLAVGWTKSWTQVLLFLALALWLTSSIYH